MSEECKWCPSKQKFLDLPNGEFECNRCYLLRHLIENNPKAAQAILKELDS